MKIMVIPLLLLLSLVTGQQERAKVVQQEVLQQNAFVLDQTIRDYKWEQMSISPFTFYRATAHLFYYDWKHGKLAVPSGWVNSNKTEAWLQGDLHLQNAGFFDHDGKIIFDLNDFDEAHQGPFFLDLIRLCASIHLIKDEVAFSMTNKDVKNCVEDFCKKYIETLEDNTSGDGENKTVIDKKFAKGFLDDVLKKVEKKKSTAKLLEKWTIENSNHRKFNLKIPMKKSFATFTGENEQYRLSAISSEKQKAWKENWDFYTQEIATPKEYLAIKDIVQRNFSGLGSLGVEKLYFLLEGQTLSNHDDWIFEIKEQTGTSSEKFFPPLTSFSNPALRVKSATQFMHAKADFSCGWLSIGNKYYSVKRISPWKDGLEGQDFEKLEELESYLKYFAIAVANAHSRADIDRQSGIDYNFEKEATKNIKNWKNFTELIVEISQDYADQVKEDWQIFRSLHESGLIK